MPCATVDSAHVVLSDRLYVIGGFWNGSTSQVCNYYDPSTNEWKSFPNVGCHRQCATAHVSNGYIYILGGLCTSRDMVFKSIERINPIWDGRWTTVIHIA